MSEGAGPANGVPFNLFRPERQDEVVYYDAFESPDAMKGEEDPAAPPPPLREEDLGVLQQRTRQLEARRGRITAKKVYLKNKKVRGRPVQRLHAALGERLSRPF